MDVDDFISIIRSLSDNEVEYIIVGGLAVVAHGYGRMTHDLDLVIKLDEHNIFNCFAALHELGYKPRVPVTAKQFADKKNREKWINKKGMTVLNFHSDKFKASPIDIFVYEPFEFETTFRNAYRQEIEDGLISLFADIPTLINMKKAAARMKDLDDIEHLKRIQEFEKED